MLLHAFLILIALLVPLYFWAYVMNISVDYQYARLRFYVGVFSGVFSVGATILFSKILDISNIYIFCASFVGIIWLMYLLLSLSLQIASPIIRTFLQKIGKVHILVASLIFVSIFLFSKILFDNVLFSGIIVALLLPAFFEEIAKHMTMLGILWKSFRFSQKDFAVFGFCVAIGFTVVENLLYLYLKNISAFDFLLRSIFAFSAHLLTVLAWIACWWQALSYRFLSLKYILWVIWGFILAWWLHFAYNFAVTVQAFGFVVLFIIASYALFVYQIH